jgi:hypothetical protein
VKATDISQVKGKMAFSCNNKDKHIVKPKIPRESEGVANDFAKLAFTDPVNLNIIIRGDLVRFTPRSQHGAISVSNRVIGN